MVAQGPDSERALPQLRTKMHKPLCDDSTPEFDTQRWQVGVPGRNGRRGAEHSEDVSQTLSANLEQRQPGTYEGRRALNSEHETGREGEVSRVSLSKD